MYTYTDGGSGQRIVLKGAGGDKCGFDRREEGNE